METYDTLNGWIVSIKHERNEILLKKTELEKKRVLFGP